MSKKVFILNKREGETPLERMEIFRRQNIKTDKIFQNIKMTYAGRLDPMASGVMIVLVGEETKNKQKYLNFTKEYDFEILFGFSTDTHDILGKVTDIIKQDVKKIELEKKLKENLKYFKGKFIQKYPLYSSKTVEGKQLFEYGRDGALVDLPEHEVEVKSLKFINLRKINPSSLLRNIERRIGKVKGDFRQKEILKIWKKQIKKDGNYFIGSFSVKCGSGTYVRSISNDLGGKIGLPALAFSIKRKKIGKYTLRG